ncbi:MAG: YqaE/Pmp3 family membrane protein [Candidatus Thorarchaeota archaeon]|jgi:uncharacterized membrane protein YqaE (UPF0057 family)
MNNDLLRVIVSILIPPVGVFCQEGLGAHFWINLVLTLTGIGYPIALIHALWVILRSQDD